MLSELALGMRLEDVHRETSGQAVSLAAPMLYIDIQTANDVQVGIRSSLLETAIQLCTLP